MPSAFSDRCPVAGLTPTFVKFSLLKELVGITNDQLPVSNTIENIQLQLMEECAGTISPAILPSNGGSTLTIKGNGFETAAEYTALLRAPFFEPDDGPPGDILRTAVARAVSTTELQFGVPVLYESQKYVLNENVVTLLTVWLAALYIAYG